MYRYIKTKFKKYKSIEFNKNDLIKKFYIDENGNAVVRVHLSNVTDGFSSFSVKGFEELNQELADYIDNVIYYIPLKYYIILEFEIEHGTNEQQELLKQLITDHYGLVFEDKKQDLAINLITIFSLLIVGVVMLATSYYLAKNEKGQLITDFINITGTFALWEMVDLILLDNRTKKIEKLNAGQTATAKIIFKNFLK